MHEQSLLDVERSIALEGLGRTPEAIESLGRAITIIESVRQRLVPADETRRGYAERWRSALSRHVQLLAQDGQMEEALAASERARARAFIDLLAAKDDEPRSQVRPTPVAAARAAPLAVRGSNSAEPSTLDDLLADLKGRAQAVQEGPRHAALDADIAASPTTLAEIRSATAARATFFLVYWVGDNQTLIWVVAPDGRISVAKSDVGDKRLAALVRATWASPETIAARAGSGEAVGAAPANDDSVAVPAWAPALRGDGTLVFDGASQRAFRELDRVLIAPVRSVLPKGGAARLTIVPHGPLFRLSFAPLLSPAGRYLIEEARLSYTPSIAALLRLRASSPTSTVGCIACCRGSRARDCGCAPRATRSAARCVGRGPGDLEPARRALDALERPHGERVTGPQGRRQRPRRPLRHARCDPGRRADGVLPRARRFRRLVE